jgi:hypothetical protein
LLSDNDPAAAFGCVASKLDRLGITSRTYERLLKELGELRRKQARRSIE